MEDKEYIELLINEAEPILNDVVEYKPTFLSVIGKDYAEVYMSSLVAYALQNDENLIKNLIELYCQEFDKDKNIKEILDFNLSNVSCSLEKSMDSKRADIFLEITDDENRIVTTITIENKTNTAEHSNQTSNYFNWVKNNYRKSNNLFFYLFPDYNESNANSPAYYNLKYSELNKLITDTDDYIILDLKQHINQRMEVDMMNINENEKLVIDNFMNYSKVMDDLSNKIINRKKELEKAFIEKMNEKFCIIDWRENNCKSDSNEKLLKEVVSDKRVGTGSLRLYKGDWYQEKKYYLYVEIKFHDTKDGPFDRITFQQTIKKYFGFSDFENWKDQSGIKDKSKESSSQHRVLDYRDFDCKEYDWNSDEWKNELVNQAYEYFEKMIKESEGISKSLYDFVFNNKDN